MSNQPTITITEQEDGSFTADRPELPGMPVVGRGRTWREALVRLVLNDRKAFGLVQVVRSAARIDAGKRADP